ncbi:MAG: TolB family protein [Ignavibacteria bacterium]
MRTKPIIFTIFCLLFIVTAFTLKQEKSTEQSGKAGYDTLIFPGEKHFKNIRMLTYDGMNAEAYFSFDGKRIIFQGIRDNYKCDQIYMMNIDGSDLHRISSGKGRTTCSYFFPDGKHILYSTTFLGGDDCPPAPDYSNGYVWPLYDTYDIFTANDDGSNLKQLTNIKGYDAESTISPKGDKIVFTSTRNGDIDIYSMDIDGSNVKQLTNELGYDGGPNYSYDGSMIVFRSSRPKTDEEIKEYKDLLSRGLVQPLKLEIYIMNADGSNIHPITNLGCASFGPYFFPGDKKVIFSTNYGDPKQMTFELYSVNIDGTGLERITYSNDFTAFPMFSLCGDGKFVFCSSRFNSSPFQANVFVCDWQ